jgi:cysteine protease ATG4
MSMLNGKADDEAIESDEEVVEAAAYTLDVVDVDDLSDDSDASSPSRRKATKQLHPGRNGQSGAERNARQTPPASPIRRRQPGTPSTPIASRRPSEAGTTKPVEIISAPVNGQTPTRPRRSTSTTASAASGSGSGKPVRKVDPSVAWYNNAYSEAQLRTFHCEKVRKLPLSGLDPSMLLGFVCRDEKEFEDFCERVKAVS